MAIMTKYVGKHITIREDQEKLIKKKSINLSRFVQRQLDEVFKNEKK